MEIIEGIRVVRLTALQKPDGGVRGIVVGDIVRWLVARTMAKQVAKQAEKATAPFQYALSTKTGCECIAHIVQSLTDVDSNATIVSIDGVGAYDLISRNSMLRGLLRMENGDQILPFVRCFYERLSTYLWEDEPGETQHIPQGEGGEQGDPLMPILFSLGQHPLEAAQRRLRDKAKFFAYLDDVVFVCRPDRVAEVEAVIREELRRHAHVDVHQGKTQVWNRGGIAPDGIEELTQGGQVGETRRSGVEGRFVFAQRVPRTEFWAHQSEHPDQLAHKSREQETLFTRIPTVQDTQACWLLLLMCASTWANFWLRMIRPDQTLQYAERHDAAVALSLCHSWVARSSSRRTGHSEFPTLHGRPRAHIG